MDVAAIEAAIDLHPQLKLLTYFAVTEEDFDGIFQGSGVAKLGEDYFTGLTVQTTPIKGLDVDLLFAFQHLQGPSLGGGFTIRIPSVGQQREDRWWLGVDARWRWGNLTVSPTFIYNGGSREFATGDATLRAFLLDLRSAYALGPLTLTAKFVYTPGNDASDTLGAGSDINVFQFIGVDTVHRSTDWFQIFGFNIDNVHPPQFGFFDSRSLRDNLSFDQFGLIHGAVRADFKALQNLTFTGALGFFAAAENVNRPARCGARVASTVTAAGASGCGQATFNFTGEDKYLGTELDVWLRYTLFRGTDVDVWFAYAFVGDALNLRHTDVGLRAAQDVVGAGARILYRF